MEITVSDKAAEVLLDKLGDDNAFLLALNEEVEGSELREHSCAKGNHFQVIPLFSETDVELIPLENPTFNVYTSEDAKALLSEHVEMDFNPRLNSFQIMCNHRYVDSNIKLKNYFFS
ncbi:iron-sulfur cluster biosynthesis family protein [Enterococcus sp. 669A]|uniref:Iron-sulfur cluster biosynthesis family protein n=1 Tax=Candidatus Enterococcus moelleringii TaxID=2815325 RepID=A0ABS3LG60_9ENTE|nr:iron-sulfur cluster biosynthesis family protein [Enterococcus sp. 669A]MBO1308633.1 iron-sulfur cluster biosynthesis family protein [Enterococcus sp. 669A]